MAVFDTRRAACESAEMTTVRNMFGSALLTAALGVVVGLGGCGGTQSDANQPLESPRDSQRHDQAKDRGEKHDEVGMPPTLRAFHDVLAPRWHAKPGPERMADTCKAIPDFRGNADAIATSQQPEGRDPAAWVAGGKQLSDAVTVLESACKSADATSFDAAFGQVHERFHGLLEAGASHDDHH
jgi:hypothetical protein